MSIKEAWDNIFFINKTKGCVDTIDSMWATYNGCRKTNRWSMEIFLQYWTLSEEIVKIYSRAIVTQWKPEGLIYDLEFHLFRNNYKGEERLILDFRWQFLLNSGDFNSENTSAPTASTTEITTPLKTNTKYILPHWKEETSLKIQVARLSRTTLSPSFKRFHEVCNHVKTQLKRTDDL